MPVTAEDRDDDYEVLSTSRQNWDRLKKPLLVRVCNRHWTSGDDPMRAVGKPLEYCPWLRKELAQFLRVRPASSPSI